MQRTKMSMIIVAGAAVAISTGAATAAEASPVVTHPATARVPGVVGDAQATAYGKISEAGLKRAGKTAKDAIELASYGHATGKIEGPPHILNVRRNELPIRAH